ncbi:MAG: plastocyanin/azurin family copper-binding protein [Acidimicrobiales bacterium]
MLAALALLAVAGPYKMLRGTPGGDGGGGGTTVSMAGTRFSPGVLTVPKGTTVLFQNDDVQAHTVTATADNIDPNIDSGIVEAGGAFTLTVEERFVYFCAIHPSMTGTIEIGA